MPILTKKRKLPSGKKRKKAVSTSGSIFHLLCNTTFKRVTLCGSILVLLIYYLLRKRVVSSPTSATLLRAIPKAVHMKKTGSHVELVSAAVEKTNDDSKKFKGRDADQYAQEKIKNMMLLHPKGDDDDDVDNEILDDDAMADKDEELAEHDMDLREPSQHDIAQSQVWKSTSGKHSPPSQRGKGNRRKGR